MDWLWIPAVLVLAAVLLVRRARSRPRHRRRTPHTYIPPCIEK